MNFSFDNDATRTAVCQLFRLLDEWVLLEADAEVRGHVVKLVIEPALTESFEYPAASDTGELTAETEVSCTMTY